MAHTIDYFSPLEPSIINFLNYATNMNVAVQAINHIEYLHNNNHMASAKIYVKSIYKCIFDSSFDLQNP